MAGIKKLPFEENKGLDGVSEESPDPIVFDLSRGEEATDDDFPPITEAELDAMDRELAEDIRLGRTVEASIFFAELRARHKLAG